MGPKIYAIMHEHPLKLRVASRCRAQSKLGQPAPSLDVFRESTKANNNCGKRQINFFFLLCSCFKTRRIRIGPGFGQEGHYQERDQGPHPWFSLKVVFVLAMTKVLQTQEQHIQKTAANDRFDETGFS